MGSDTELTPMMAQYRRIKGELPKDALLLFRLGDFYELFFEDAQIGAQLLNVALTRRGAVPMCGIPFHAAGGYVAKLLKAGRKVAICDQMEDARSGQLVKREVTQILSPGTHFDERMLSAERNNYLAAICAVGKAFGLAFVDLTTGDFTTSELENRASKARCWPRSFRDVTHTGPLPGGDLTHPSRPALPSLEGQGVGSRRVRAGFSMAMTTGFSLRKRRSTPCAIISKSRHWTVLV